MMIKVQIRAKRIYRMPADKDSAMKAAWYWIKATCDVLSGEYSIRSTVAGMSCQVKDLSKTPIICRYFLHLNIC